MTEQGSFSGTSARGDFAEALRGAVDAATRGLNTNWFAWKLKGTSGSVGGIVGAHDVRVEIEVGGSGQNRLLAEAGTADCGDWYAWHDHMPGSTPSLHVVGRCVFPTSGYSVKLRPATPPGINPSIYLLDKIVHEPTGPVADVVTEVPVHFQQAGKDNYTEVQILPDHTVVPIRDVS
jgi:hypothetical protein